ncbi:cobalamin biosynthesis bifunctional protein CbiET, partial [[Kitasatospora] papulosa]
MSPASPLPAVPAPASAVSVVGIGADGWAGLPETARAVLLNAEVLIGGER